MGNVGRPSFGEMYTKYKGLKEAFIAEYSDEENTQKIYERVLVKARKTEEFFDKDLCEFNFDELDTLLSRLNAGTLASIQVQFRIIRQYLEFTKSKGYTLINYAGILKPQELSKYVNQIRYKKQFITKEDVLDIIDAVDMYSGNAQDYLPIVLIFNGCWGADLEELINLKKDDINEEEGTITLTTKDQKRTININKEWFEFINYAINEEIYIKNNGQDLDDLKYSEVKLVDSEYVLRPIERGYAGQKITSGTIRQRIKKIREFWGNEYINPTSILNSGIIEFTKKYISDNNKNNVYELTTEDFKYITNRFGKKEARSHATKHIILNYFENNAN